MSAPMASPASKDPHARPLRRGDLVRVSELYVRWLLLNEVFLSSNGFHLFSLQRNSGSEAIERSGRTIGSRH
jgi:hypothetical protein